MGYRGKLDDHFCEKHALEKGIQSNDMSILDVNRVIYR